MCTILHAGLRSSWQERYWNSTLQEGPCIQNYHPQRRTREKRRNLMYCLKVLIRSKDNVICVRQLEQINARTNPYTHVPLAGLHSMWTALNYSKTWMTCVIIVLIFLKLLKPLSCILDRNISVINSLQAPLLFDRCELSSFSSVKHECSLNPTFQYGGSRCVSLIASKTEWRISTLLRLPSKPCLRNV